MTSYRSEGVDYDFWFKAVLVGDTEVGKTSIFRRYKTGSFAMRRGSTVESDRHYKTFIVDGKNVVLELWDTAGQEKFRTLTNSYFRGVNAVLFVYDISNMESFRNLKNWREAVQRYVDEKTCKVLIGNKTDLEISRKVTTEEAETLSETYEMSALFETSAKTSYNTSEVFELIARTLKRQHEGGEPLTQNTGSNIKLGTTGSSQAQEENSEQPCWSNVC